METSKKKSTNKRKPEEDFELYKEYLRVPNGKKAEFMRKHGLYPAELVRIEEVCSTGAVAALKERKSRKKNRLVPETEVTDREERIRELEASIADLVGENRILKKKANGD